MGLLAGATQYASGLDAASGQKLSKALYAAFAGLTFTGGCALPALTFAPTVWPRRWILPAVAAAGAAGFSWGMGLFHLPTAALIAPDYRGVLSLQLALFLAGGCSVLALAVADWRSRKDAESALLALWVMGTFVFASLLNWTVNARSVLPMIPAVGILLARRMETGKWPLAKLAAPLVVSGMISLCLTWADTNLANSARTAALFVRDHLRAPGVKISFEGHWGFQYYMEAFGCSPINIHEFHFQTGDMVVIPNNNSNAYVHSIPPAWIASQQVLAIAAGNGLTTMNQALGAGFYSDVWGPLPFSFGRVPSEDYSLLRLQAPATK
jgi:hypothetical protein